MGMRIFLIPLTKILLYSKEEISTGTMRLGITLDFPKDQRNSRFGKTLGTDNLFRRSVLLSK